MPSLDLVMNTSARPYDVTDFRIGHPGRSRDDADLDADAA